MMMHRGSVTSCHYSYTSLVWPTHASFSRHKHVHKVSLLACTMESKHRRQANRLIRGVSHVSWGAMLVHNKGTDSHY